MINQYPETLARLCGDIARTKARLQGEASPSEIANTLFLQGLSSIEIFIVFKEATGASIRDLKAFSQWWGASGVTDRDAFDCWAGEAFSLH
ncbi:hypothetical protein ACSFBI_33490 [Variovorax sp. RB3P1]|uniref:hypothetical protein n=1 Tax=Variovorax sp. RB3P1 TaxID=3443732 RepID=UPI003F487A76